MIQILFSLLLTATPARAETSYSRLLARIQGTVLPKAAPYPILIMDRDDLEWRFARAHATTASDEAARAQIIQVYVKEKTGVAIPDGAAINFDPYLTTLKDAAIAMPALNDNSKPLMCAVFPPDPNRNQRLETERLLQLGVAEAYGKHSYPELRATLAYDDAILFSILHESGHCMDTTWFPQLYAGDDDPSVIHGAESFAETMGAFLMAREGRVGITDQRAYLRDMYSYFMEPYFVAHPELGFGNSGFSYGGLIYHLSPSLHAAGSVISARLPEVLAMPLGDVLALARQVVEKNAFDNRFLTALFAGYSEGREVALQRYQGYEKEMPDLFGGITARLTGYWGDTDAFRAGAFGPAAAPDPHETQLLPLDYKAACAALAKGDIDSILAQVETLRQDLRAGNPAYAAQTARFSELSNLWTSLPARCQGAAVLLSRKAPLVDLPF